MINTAQSYLKLVQLLLSWEERQLQTREDLTGDAAPSIATHLREARARVQEALQSLEKAEALASASSAAPPSSPSPTPPPSGGQDALPRDGRYTCKGAGLTVELRIDAKESAMVSGDIFAIEGSQQIYRGSFRTIPGEELGRQSNPLHVVLEGPHNTRASGTLRFAPSEAADTSVTLTLKEATGTWSPGQAWTWPATFEGPEMRVLGIELEIEAETDNFPSWEHNGAKKTIDSCLNDAGFAVRNVGRRDSIPHHPSGRWDEAQLHGLMHQFAQEPLDRPTWNLHLLLLQEARMRGLLGIMFDSGQRDINQLPRQGVAVFQRPIKQRWDWQRKIIQTTVHELGHALNLAHRFELPVGRADSTSFMNYDWKYMGGNQADAFWKNFAFAFDRDELDFLRHGPWNHIVPGGAPFHTIPYWENRGGGYVPYIPEVPSQDFKIELKPPQSGASFQFGQPVLLTVALTNTSNRTVRVPKFMLSPKSGFLQVQVQRGDEKFHAYDHDHRDEYGHGGYFHPIVHRCYDLDQSEATELAPGETLTDNLNLTFGSAGFTFAEPGSYRARATFIWQVGVREYRTIHSTPLTLQVQPPTSSEEEREMADFFRWEVGFYFALGGSDILSGAESTLLDLVERRQYRLGGSLDPLTTNIMRSRAINQSRDFVSYHDGSFSVRPAHPAQAYSDLSLVTENSFDVFDPATEMSNNQFLDALRSEMEMDLGMEE